MISLQGTPIGKPTSAALVPKKSDYDQSNKSVKIVSRNPFPSPLSITGNCTFLLHCNPSISEILPPSRTPFFRGCFLIDSLYLYAADGPIIGVLRSNSSPIGCLV